MLERLLKCRLCGGNVSSAASKCPHCGTPNFKPNSLQRADAAIQARKEKIEARRKDLLMDGLSSAEGYSDDEIRTYFPDSVKITLKVNTNSVDKSCRFIVKNFYSGAIDPHDGWIYHSDFDGPRTSKDFIFRTGTHRIFLSVKQIDASAKKPNRLLKANEDTQSFNIIINRDTKCIIVNTDSRCEFLTGKRKLLNPSVRVM